MSQPTHTDITDRLARIETHIGAIQGDVAEIKGRLSPVELDLARGKGALAGAIAAGGFAGGMVTLLASWLRP